MELLQPLFTVLLLTSGRNDYEAITWSTDS